MADKEKKQAEEEKKEQKAKTGKEESPKKDAPKETPKKDAPKETPKKDSQKKENKSEEAPKKKGSSRVSVEDATPAQVVKVFKKAGLYGECYQVLVRILSGNDKGNLLRRNVRGPVRENDVLMLKETERDARAI